MRRMDFLIIGVGYTLSLGQASLIPGIVLSRGHIFCLALRSHAKINRLNVKVACTHRMEDAVGPAGYVAAKAKQQALRGGQSGGEVW